MNSIEHLATVIKDTLDYEKDSFYFHLRDNGVFNVQKFEILTDACFELHNKDLTKTQRLEIAVVLWETALQTESLISCHHNKKDMFKIKDMTNEDLKEIFDILFYMCNWFTYGKEMEKKLLTIGGWRT